MLTQGRVTAPSDTTIVSAAIHPAIGIARVGNSLSRWCYGPDVPEPLPAHPGFYRDAAGALIRLAARFRLYGLNAAGEVVAELTAANAEITWNVHLANKKAAWFDFNLAQDIAEKSLIAKSQRLRNIVVRDRAALVIDPGAHTISGRDQQGNPCVGQFMQADVYLGELRTDSEGRLIVLGGHGKSFSPTGAKLTTFANNDGWCDDTADGPVTAQVVLPGAVTPLPVAPAWVVVAPPDYAPGQKSVRTMWDLMRDVAIAAGQLPRPPRPSFRDDIMPIFTRLTALQWVNKGFAIGFGWKSAQDFASADWLRQLNDASAACAGQRNDLYERFRDFNRDGDYAPGKWPWLYGDAMHGDPNSVYTPRQNSVLSATQLAMLAQWAAGDFTPDYDPAYQPPRSIDQVPLADQPATLDRASLEWCLADAFHPGCEMTWPMRVPSLYMAPFRLRHAPAGWHEPDYGSIFDPDRVTLRDDPFKAQVPGGITRWMAVPWQADTASCRSGYDKKYDPHLPTFWPARVPNDVLAAADYAIVMDKSLRMQDRLDAFERRVSWTSPLDLPPDKNCPRVSMYRLVDDIARVGIVETRCGPTDTALFPATLGVEQLKTPDAAGPTAARLQGGAELDEMLDDKLNWHRLARNRP